LAILLKQRLAIEIYASGDDEKEAKEKLREIRQKILDIEKVHSLSWATEISKHSLMRSELETSILGAFYRPIRQAVEEAMVDLKPTGTAVSLTLPDPSDIAEKEIEELAYELALKIGSEPKWLREKNYHKEAMEFTSKELMEHLS
jgi:hypothetical protein